MTLLPLAPQPECYRVSDAEVIGLLETPSRLLEAALAARVPIEQALAAFTEAQRLAVTHGVLASLYVTLDPATVTPACTAARANVVAARPTRDGAIVWLRGRAQDPEGEELGSFAAIAVLAGERLVRGLGAVPDGMRNGPTSHPGAEWRVEIPISEGLARASAETIGDTNPIHYDRRAAGPLGANGLIVPALALFALAEHGALVKAGPEVIIPTTLGLRLVRPVVEGEFLGLDYSVDWSQPSRPVGRFIGRAPDATPIKGGRFEGQPPANMRSSAGTEVGRS